MKLKKLIALITLIFVTLPIQHFAQKDFSDSLICYTPKQVKFFLKQNVIAKGLQIDTALLRSQIKDLNSILTLTQDQRSGLNFALKEQTQLADNYRLSYSVLQEKYDKKVKWNIRYKKVIICVSAVAILEGGLIYFAFK